MKTNNKTVVIVLLGVVGFIWFKLFMRVFENSTMEDSTYSPSQTAFTAKIEKPSYFKLNAAYADPFRVSKAKRVADPTAQLNNPAINPQPVKPKPEPKIIYWPAIKYYGFVKNNNSGKTPRALVSVDGSIYKLKSNDAIMDGLELKSLTRNQIVLKYKGEQKTFIKVE